MKKLTGWKLFLYSMAGLGPNLLMTLVTGYLNDALLAPTGIDPAKTLTGSLMVSVGLCSGLFFIAKLLDAFIDVPLAYLSDRLHCKMNRRKATILMGWFPMVGSFLLLWNPGIFGNTSATAFTWIEAILLVVFYSSYTLSLVSYYGSYSSITEDEKQLAKLTHFKAFFDTIQYCVAYALFPALLLHLLGGDEPGAISKAMLMMSPLMLTMLIPVWLIKGKNEDDQVDQRIPLSESIKISFSSKPFRNWLCMLVLMYMGLMLFLTGIGTTIPDSLMGIRGWKITVMNSAAFAPVPLMLLIHSFISKRKGLRFALQVALVAYAVSMFTFAAAWKGIWGGSDMIPFIIGLIASTIGSYGVGVIFSIVYYFPSQIAAKEIKTTGKDHAAMYFAIQGLATQIASGIGVNLIYTNLVSRQIPLFGIEGGQYVLVPAIAGILLLLAFFAAFRMKDEMYKD